MAPQVRRVDSVRLRSQLTLSFTDAAGTFAVSSLGRSSSFSYNSALPSTTSFVVNSPAFASPAAVETPSGFNAPIVTSVPLLSQSSSMPISLVTTTSVSVEAAPTSRPDGAASHRVAAAGWAVGALGVVAAFAF